MQTTFDELICIFARQILSCMIQRIQTVYMLLAGIVSILLATFFTIWNSSEGAFIAMDNPVYAFFAGMSGGMLIANIFNFKKRKLQVVLNRIVLFFCLVLAGFLIYEYVTLIQTDEAIRPGIGLAVPLVTIILIVMANRAITKDEELVRSADRFR